MKMTPRSPRLGLALLLALLTACEARRDAAAAPHGGALGQAAALVDGEAISLDEVRALCAASGLSPRQALARLVGERLLARYAEQRGYGELPEVQQGVERARVQALLALEVESSGSPASDEQRRDKLARLVLELEHRTRPAYQESAIRKAFLRAGE
ncbi:MAG: hypothetical protein JWN04_6855 [Myxococcaceae bacterium]|nr:hypothetical protein [Myxococcaceae bacterium]